MKKIKRLLSAILTVTITLTLVLTTLVSSGVTVSFAASPIAYLNELWLVNGHSRVLLRGTPTEITGAPYDVSGETAYLPMSALSLYTGATYTVDGDSVTVYNSYGDVAYLTVGSTEWAWGDGTPTDELLLPVLYTDGELYISIMTARTLLSVKAFYNPDLDLTVVSDSSLDYTRARGVKLSSWGNGYLAQAEVLGNLFFERPTGDTVLNDIEANVGLEAHPRLLANAERFDELSAIYLGRLTDNELYEYISNHANKGFWVFNDYFTETDGEVVWESEEKRESLRQPYYLYDEYGNRLVGLTEYTYVDGNGETVTLEVGGSGLGDGYDYGGRSNVAQHTKKLKQLAFSWQMTGEQKYADAFYLLAVELGKWEHWGEGHFLNVADGAVEVAIGLDWIWHAFDSEPQKRDEVAAILYRLGLQKGYYSIVCDSLYSGSEPKLSQSAASNYLVISQKAGSTAWRTLNRDNNWQTVCGSGMIVTALMLSHYEEYRTECAFVIEEYLESLEKCLHQYAPDGGYIESPGYWGYGTNTLMVQLGSLISSAGKDYGYSDIVGLHDSFYYTVGIADSEYRMWNYHDSSEGSIDYSSLYLASQVYSDPTLAYLRNKMIFEAERDMELMDVIYYTPELAEGAVPDNVPLDFNFIGINTATFHSSYETGSVFAGLHTGPNHTTHGDYDCGNFTLSMGGIQWIKDPGTENYNLTNFWQSGESGQRYRLYCKSVEGHSTVMITSNSSIPLGQRYTTSSTDYATIDSYYSDVYGGYAITDMTYEYGNTCNSGRRGVLLTNSRSTVVLQDEISFSSPTSLAWVLNLGQNLFISDDGRSIDVIGYGKGNDPITLRVTLISEDTSLKFRQMFSDETVFDHTYTESKNAVGTKDEGLARDPVQRVVIEASDVTDFNVAVVFQLLGHKDEIVPYEYTSMSEWTTVSDDWVKEANSGIDYSGSTTVYKYGLSHFMKANERLAAAKTDLEIAAILRDTADLLNSYDYTNERVEAQAVIYRAYRREYVEKLRDANDVFRGILFGG